MSICKIAAMIIGILIAGGHSNTPTAESNRCKNKSANESKITEKTNDSGHDCRGHHDLSTLRIELADTPVVQLIPAESKEKPTEKKERHFDEKAKAWLINSKDWLTSAGSVAAVIGAVLSLFMAWIIIRSSNRHLRAYLGITDLRIVEPCMIHFSVKNYGLTPAQRVQVWCDCPDTPRNPLLITWLPKHGISDGAIISPGESTEHRCPRVGLPEEYFVNGKIRYFDTFGKSHYTIFHYAVQKGPNGLHCVVHPTGNEQT